MLGFRDHPARAVEDPWIGEHAEGEHGTGKRPAVEQIEHQNHDDDIHCDCSCLRNTRAPHWLLPNEQAERPGEHQ